MTTTSDFLRHLRTLADRQASDSLSDQQLLERFLNERSEASFAALVQRHGPMVLRVCRRVLHHVQDAEDAFQATFLILAPTPVPFANPNRWEAGCTASPFTVPIACAKSACRTARGASASRSGWQCAGRHYLARSAFGSG